MLTDKRDLLTIANQCTESFSILRGEVNIVIDDLKNSRSSEPDEICPETLQLVNENTDEMVRLPFVNRVGLDKLFKFLNEIGLY